MPRSQKQRSVKNDYPENWAEIARAIKDAADWKCVRCAHPHDVSSHHVLTVHHLDMDPGNNELWNLAALCQRCHLRIQSKVDFHQQYMLEHTPWMRPFVEDFKEAKGLT